MDNQLKYISPKQALETRQKLLREYGSKIIDGPRNSLTDKEQAASILYKAISEELHNAAHGTKIPDKLLEFYEKQGVNNVFELITKYAPRVFLVLLAILAFIAVLKYILS